ncbi:SRPBCC family protein [Kocuria sp.]|jgi:uncharacterized protein YndB with AHSA1/START domain|nr:SRPBCC family protein [Kocuria sp.]
MSTRVEKTVVVDVPVTTVYNQWTQFEEFPHFMGGVQSVRQLGDDRLEWVAELGGVRRQWQAQVLEQVPDRKVSWAATEGATNAGTVEFQAVGAAQTQVHLVLEYEPEGLVEKIGDKLNVVENQAEKDLERFKAFIEDAGYATGAWRGAVNPGAAVGAPGVQDAAGSRGDSGKAGVSGKVIAAGVAAAGVAAAGAAAAAKSTDTGTNAGTEANAATDSGPVTPPTPSAEAGATAEVTTAPATEDLIPSTGAPRTADVGATPEQPLPVDARLDEEPAPPLGEVPPIVASDIDQPDLVPDEDRRAGADPVTGRPDGNDRPAGDAV